MLETPEDLGQLQALLDESARRASPSLRETFEIPDRTPAPAAIAEYLSGPVDLALATVTGRGEPRVAPVTALFVHGRALLAGPGDAVCSEIDGLHQAAWWEPLRSQDRGVCVGIDAARFFAWAGPGWPGPLRAHPQ